MNPSYSDRPMACDFDIYMTRHEGIKELHRSIDKPGHKGTIFELSLPDGISFGYYNFESSTPGVIHINNLNPFVRLSYTINGNKLYAIDDLMNSVQTIPSLSTRN